MASSLSDGTSINITKLVQWPVVLKVPLLLTTLYIGHLYIKVFGSSFDELVTGTNCMVGQSENNSLGFESPNKWVFLSHLAPSKNSPHT